MKHWSLVFDILLEKCDLTVSVPESNLESTTVVVTFKFVDETLVCDHSNDSYLVVLVFHVVVSVSRYFT